MTPKLVLHDRDTKFTKQFDEILKSQGVEVKRTTPLSPNLQAHVGLMIQTLKYEYLNSSVVMSTGHLNRICREFRT